MHSAFTQQNYRDNFVEQTRRWVAGDPVHNLLSWVDGVGGGGECCADFSCCYPDMLEADPNKRMAWALDTFERIPWLDPSMLVT